MTFIKRTIRLIVFSVLSILGGITLGATLVGAVTTISTNITTAGTFNADDTATLGSTLAVTGSTTIASLLNVGGDAMLSSTTATSLKVGQTGTRHTALVSGYCTFPTVTVTATSTAFAICTGATGLAVGDRVFVQATSSLPAGMVIQSASTTVAEVISIQLNNVNTGANTASGINSVNFWAVR